MDGCQNHVHVTYNICTCQNHMHVTYNICTCQNHVHVTYNVGTYSQKHTLYAEDMHVHVQSPGLRSFFPSPEFATFTKKMMA
jgi:hypothetical protein